MVLLEVALGKWWWEVQCVATIFYGLYWTCFALCEFIYLSKERGKEKLKFIWLGIMVVDVGIVVSLRLEHRTFIYYESVNEMCMTEN